MAGKACRCVLAGGASVVLLLALACQAKPPQNAGTSPATKLEEASAQPDRCNQGNAANRVDTVVLHRRNGTRQSFATGDTICGIIYDNGVNLNAPPHDVHAAPTAAPDTTSLATTPVCQWIGNQWVCS